MSNRASKTINSKFFQDEIKNAIQEGHYTDYGFNGVDEVAYEAFNEGIAFRAVLKVIKKYFTKPEKEGEK